MPRRRLRETRAVTKRAGIRPNCRTTPIAIAAAAAVQHVNLDVNLDVGIAMPDRGRRDGDRDRHYVSPASYPVTKSPCALHCYTGVISRRGLRVEGEAIRRRATIDPRGKSHDPRSIPCRGPSRGRRHSAVARHRSRFHTPSPSRITGWVAAPRAVPRHADVWRNGIEWSFQRRLPGRKNAHCKHRGQRRVLT